MLCPDYIVKSCTEKEIPVNFPRMLFRELARNAAVSGGIDGDSIGLPVPQCIKALTFKHVACVVQHFRQSAQYRSFCVADCAVAQLILVAVAAYAFKLVVAIIFNACQAAFLVIEIVFPGSVVAGINSEAKQLSLFVIAALKLGSVITGSCADDFDFPAGLVVEIF